jgi:hypothetical protein
MKIIQYTIAIFLLLNTSTWGGGKVHFSSDVDAALERYGLYRPETLVDVTRNHCGSEADERINHPRYDKGFQVAQKIVINTARHFKELYESQTSKSQTDSFTLRCLLFTRSFPPEIPTIVGRGRKSYCN